MPLSLLLLGAGAGCGDAPGFIEARGAWADSESIRFHQEISFQRRNGDRIEIVAEDQRRPRFMGVRLAIDTSKVGLPGPYEVDPQAGGFLEIYFKRPDQTMPGVASLDAVEYEASTGRVHLDVVPVGGEKLLQGTFREVKVIRQGNLLLQINEGSFHARLP